MNNTKFYFFFLFLKHPSATHLLGEVGAVEFLTQLRLIVELKQQATIDGILDGLFQLPEIPPDFPAISFHGKPAVLTEQKAVPPVQAEDEPPSVGYFQNIITRPSEIPPQRIAESLKVFLRVLELLSENILLLKDSVSEEVWVDDSIIGWELKEKLLSSLDSLGETLFYHLNSSCDQSEPILVNHRLAYIGTAIFTIRLLQTLVPVGKASEVLPESTGAALFHLSLDLPFRMAFQSIHESAAAYLEQLSSENYSVYKSATRAVRSIECTCTFLKEVKMEGKKNLLELLELADQAVGSLSYHQHLPLVKEITGLCSHIWKSVQASPILQAESQKGFLKLLSHPLLAVKVEAYACSLNIVKECLGIHNVTKPVSSICHGVHFLLHARVLYEICTFGLQVPEEQVCSAARDILVYLLQGQLMMTALTWNTFIDTVYHIVPILQSKDCLLLPCLSLLRKLVYADPLLRHSLAQQPSLLLMLLRASLIVKENKGNVTEAAALICLLLFDEVARMDMWIDNLPSCLAPPSPFSIPVTVVRRFLDCLKLSPVESLMLKVTHVTSGLQDCLDTINSAVAHGTVSSVLTRMCFYLLSDKLSLKQGPDSSKTMLRTLEWRSALSRFLQVLPACTDDEKLLVDVVVFLNQFFKHQSETDSEDLQWILEVVLKQLAAKLLRYLRVSDAPRFYGLPSLERTLRGMVHVTVLPGWSLHSPIQEPDSLCTKYLTGLLELAAKLLRYLRVSDAPRFYGLPSLERTLRGMVHVTVLPGWSLHSPIQEPDSLCTKYLTGLLEVVSSFYVEWGGNAMSFMGKGVTKSAVLCLLQLSHEMIVQTKTEDWISSWSLAYDQNSDEQAATRLGLAWLIPLWFDRDPEVRFASLGIGSALTSVESGCIALTASCQNISGGLWGTVLNILLDQLECSMVRREAAFILQNLLVMPMPANIEEAKDFAWQSPCVHDEDSGLSLVGLPALQVLLYHGQFSEHASQIVKTCYLGRHSFDLNYPRASITLTGNITEGQSDTDTSSLSTEDSRMPQDHCVIVTPPLLSAICGLLTNLLAVLPECTLSAINQYHILSSLTSLVDASLLERCFWELRSPSSALGYRLDIKAQKVQYVIDRELVKHSYALPAETLFCFFCTAKYSGDDLQYHDGRSKHLGIFRPEGWWERLEWFPNDWIKKCTFITRKCV
ncbi:UNVERIFIED_CONTAM: hypothetical protein FKN15_071650 [Acipenser sinensis]